MKLFLIIIYFICGISSCQDQEDKGPLVEPEEILGVEVNDRIAIDRKLMDTFLEFLNEGKARGYNYTDIILDSVNLIVAADYLHYPEEMGLYIRKHRTVYVAEYVFIEDLAVRAILYHELAHSLVKLLPEEEQHACYQCGEIMSTHSPNTFSIYADPDDWSTYVDNLFIWIEKNRQ